MKNTNSNPNIGLLILTAVLFGISFVLIGCGDNNQPSIKAMTDDTVADQSITLAVNSRRTVEIYITDVDDDDTHTVTASSENTTVAAVSVEDTMYDRNFTVAGVALFDDTDDAILTITGVGVGNTTVTVTATDDSGEGNAATRLTFEITVVEPHVTASTPLPLTELSVEESVVTLTLVGFIYERGGLGYSIRVNDLHDVGTFEYRVGRVSDTVAKVIFDGNFDTHNAMLTFIVRASAIAEYEGPPLTAQIPVIDAADIQGPWLWMAAPTDPNAGGGVSTEIDSLAEASNNWVTENDIAKKGANEGDIIGQFQWISASIRNTHEVCERFCAPTTGGVQPYAG